jgi:hypothetical protein
MRRIVHNEEGVALLTTLMLTVLGFGVVTTLLYMVTQGTKTTRLEQEYATALDAAKGGADIIINMMENELFSSPALASTVSSNAPCLEEKLTNPTTDSEPSLNWPSCTAQATGSDPMTDPDLTLTLANHQVFVKIIHTTKTNINFLYLINVRAEIPGSQEHVEISFLYQLPIPET